MTLPCKQLPRIVSGLFQMVPKTLRRGLMELELSEVPAPSRGRKKERDVKAQVSKSRCWKKISSSCSQSLQRATRCGKVCYGLIYHGVRSLSVSRIGLLGESAYGSQAIFFSQFCHQGKVEPSYFKKLPLCTGVNRAITSRIPIMLS